MKSNVVLHSSDRELFGVTIRQNTKEEFLSVTDLQKAFEIGKLSHGWTGQNINQLLLTKELARKCYGALLEAKIVNCDMSQFMELVENKSLAKVLKDFGVYKVTGKGDNKQVMAHPYVWFSIAIELNYILYGKVIVWLADTLIFDRIEAGTEYLPMNKAIESVVNKPEYFKYAIAINKKVFGLHQTGIRNLASSKQLRKIADIEKFVINAINQNWIKTETEILNAIENYN